mmetsp:Transcript_5412/g.11954  ORF Transcript_5412/g.11954 Transcript_5412/m.11954 type:complete len:221 (+) Transcript_5412:393-1055(+)
MEARPQDPQAHACRQGAARHGHLHLGDLRLREGGRMAHRPRPYGQDATGGLSAQHHHLRRGHLGLRARLRVDGRAAVAAADAKRVGRGRPHHAQRSDWSLRALRPVGAGALAARGGDARPRPYRRRHLLQRRANRARQRLAPRRVAACPSPPPAHGGAAGCARHRLVQRRPQRPRPRRSVEAGRSPPPAAAQGRDLISTREVGRGRRGHRRRRRRLAARD